MAHTIQTQANKEGAITMIKEQLDTAELALIKGALSSLVETIKENVGFEKTKDSQDRNKKFISVQESNIRFIEELINKCERIMESRL
jgi:hypothetical protein